MQKCFYQWRSTHATGRYLLHKRAPVNATDRWGHTPLAEAVKAGHNISAAIVAAAGGELGGIKSDTARKVGHQSGELSEGSQGRGGPTNEQKEAAAAAFAAAAAAAAAGSDVSINEALRAISATRKAVNHPRCRRVPPSHRLAMVTEPRLAYSVTAHVLTTLPKLRMALFGLFSLLTSEFGAKDTPPMTTVRAVSPHPVTTD